MVNFFNMDCMEYLASCKDKQFDLSIVDPPYGIGAENHAGNIENGWKQWEKKQWDNDIPTKEYFNELFRVSKNQIIWGGNYFANLLPNSQCWIFWDKGQRNFSLADGELCWTSFKKSLRVFEMSRAKSKSSIGIDKIHPTQKPIELYKWILQNYANHGDKILDTHGGSMSSAIACHDMNFDLDIIELDKDYYENALQRFKNHTDQLRLM